MTDIALAAACYVGLVCAACCAVAAGLELLTSPQAVQIVSDAARHLENR